MENARRYEVREGSGYKEQLTQAFEQLFPEAVRERRVEGQKQAEETLKKHEEVVVSRDITEAAREYRADLSGINKEETCFVEDEETQERYEYDQVMSLPVRNHFSDKRLPAGYGYKGGAARVLLLRALGTDPTYRPRDIDVVRLSWDEDSSDRDDEVSKEFMPEDYEHGDGVEIIDERDQYLATRDFKLNEILATDDRVWFTEGALLDTLRHIIRPTEFEKFNWSDSGELGPKMLAKLLRFYAEAIHRYDEAGIEDVEDWQFEEGFISPFWLALQLDRACDVNQHVAQTYVDELVTRGQLPSDIESIDQASEYLISLIHNFYYRHAPEEQFDIEYEWTEEFEDDLNNRRKITTGQNI